MGKKYKCLVCGHVWESDIEPSRCGAGCGSYWLIENEKFEKLKQELRNIINPTSTPILNFVEAFITVVQNSDLPIVLRRAWLCAGRIIHELITEELEGGMNV